MGARVSFSPVFFGAGEDEPELAPVEVDPAPYVLLGIGQRQARSADEPEKAALEFGFGHAVGVAIEDRAELADAPTPAVHAERVAQCLRIDEVEHVGFGNRGFEDAHTEPAWRGRQGCEPGS
jgi:hypothetical protein